ncbi:hypothetical protein HDG37_005682 [Paraburkholderia sp. MM5384-R2]|nr:hypothetical protein [Paraburkholderia sp. MM5384-R2]
MALSAKDAMGRSRLNVVADRGYFSGPEIRACDLNDISTYVPKPLTSASRKKGLFTKADFVYVAKSECIDVLPASVPSFDLLPLSTI